MTIALTVLPAVAVLVAIGQVIRVPQSGNRAAPSHWPIEAVLLAAAKRVATMQAVPGGRAIRALRRRPATDDGEAIEPACDRRPDRWRWYRHCRGGGSID